MRAMCFPRALSADDKAPAMGAVYMYQPYMANNSLSPSQVLR
jgi:hypothetical protein